MNKGTEQRDRRAPEAGCGTLLRVGQDAVVARLIEIQGSASWRLARPIRHLEQRTPALVRALALLAELLYAAFAGKLTGYLRKRKDIKSIYASGRFDPTWYSQRYPEVLLSGDDPAFHYLTRGARAGYWPNPKLDPLAQRSATAGSDDDMVNPLRVWLAPKLEVGAVGGDWAGAATDSLRERLLESGLFDGDWYLATYPEVAQAACDPLFHYMERGWREGRSPSDRFNGEVYLQGRPEVRAAGVCPLQHFVISGDFQDPANERFISGFRARQAVAALAGTIAHLEPELGKGAAADGVFHLRCRDGRATGRLFDAWSRIFSAIDRPFDRIVCVPHIGRGWAQRVAKQAARLAAERHGPNGALLIAADCGPSAGGDGIPRGAGLLNVADAAPYLDLAERESLVEMIIQALRPRALFNLGSGACWKVIRRRGKALSTFCDLYVGLSARELRNSGSAMGYGDLDLRQVLRDGFSLIRKVYLDSTGARTDLIEDLGIPERLRSRLEVIWPPTLYEAALWETVRGDAVDSLRVLWVVQARSAECDGLRSALPGLAARSRLDLRVCGDDSRAGVESGDSASRVRLSAVDCVRDALAGDDYDALLLTSPCEGFRELLYDAALAGIPIVVGDFAGANEFIDSNTGWLVREPANACAYVDALERVRLGRADAVRRAANLMARVAGPHPPVTYLDALSASPFFCD